MQNNNKIHYTNKSPNNIKKMVCKTKPTHMMEKYQWHASLKGMCLTNKVLYLKGRESGGV